MKYPNGHEFDTRSLRPSQIRVDPLYQRDLETKRVEKTAREFNGDLFDEPKVSYRDGVYWVFDGQHRIAIWRAVHKGKDFPLTCKVFRGMTWLDEADAFIKQNGIKKDPTTNDKLRAAFNSKDPDVVQMVSDANLCGFVVDFVVSKTPIRIVATSALYRAFKALGHEAFLDMMTAIRDAWYGDVDAVSRQVLTGMTTFYKTYWGCFKREDLVSSLRKTRPIDIIRNGKTVSTSNGYAKEILRLYNVKRKTKRLPDEL